MTTITTLLVGAHFRPPAKQVLTALPSGSLLRLQPEPENPYDPKAIRVLASFESIPESQYSELDDRMIGTGHDLESLRAAGEIFLGFVPDSAGKVCRDSGLPGNGDVHVMAHEAGVEVEGLEAKLAFCPDGKPAVEIELPAKAKP